MKQQLTSTYDPNIKTEILAAEDAKDDVREILTKLIGPSIRYVRLGYTVGAPPPTVLRMFEKQVETLETEKLQAIEQRNKKEAEEIDFQIVIRYLYYCMEHMEELLLRGSDPLKDAALFSLIFDEPPTYQNLVDGTALLSPIFELNEDFKKDRSNVVDPRGLEPLT